ncbi:MAG TPA: type II toxin-antitoxin system HicA family toxin [Solirubrobacteraceae bacterium]|nr:type II toxin-antitoxin system HicA family toxin [Solirubrobacteraceae bacterium]
MIAILEAHGWHHVRTTGGHRIYQHPVNPRSVVVAGKRSDPVPTGTLGRIRRTTGLKGLR